MSEDALCEKARPRAGRLVVTGAAGLVGQNLLPRLKESGWTEIVAIDKHPANTRILRELHPDITVIETDLARDDGWQEALGGAVAMVVGHAQIGGLVEGEFLDNNVRATERLFTAARAAGVPHAVQISSSVVNSAAVDFYTESKKAQEAVALGSGIPSVVLRPTLMFGWFDRKHLGWLARFMAKAPIFPVPGDGRYRRQPLYAGDFCAIVRSCLERRIAGESYNISGLETVDYIDLIRRLRAVLELRTPVVTIPYGLFKTMLQLYALVDRNPPFTAKQLEALATPDMFEVIDWPAIFGVKATPLDRALRETYRDPRFSQVALEF